MRARTIREGSVGLLILAGLALFGGLVMWLRGMTFGQRNYRFSADFESANGILEGSTVSYRGVQVGHILSISPDSNTVLVEIEIHQSGLRIPADSVVKTSQSGLIGETTISIEPPSSDTDLVAESVPGPTTRECDSTVILCHGDRIDGEVGVNYEDLLESSQKISEDLSRALDDPQTLGNIREILANTRAISGNVVGLTDEVTLMARDLRNEIQPLSASTRQTLESVSGAASQLEATTIRTSEQLDTTLTQVNSILTTNQGELAITLENISASTGQLRMAMDTLAPVIQEGTLVDNIELLANNAAIASQDLRDISSSLNTGENLVLLQQTIESARDVFQSAQKIMADVDTLTGDPTLRSTVRDLLNGLSALISFTGDLENQTEVAGRLNQELQTVTKERLATPSSQPEMGLDELSQTEPTAQPTLRYNGERYVTDLANRPEDPTAAE